MHTIRDPDADGVTLVFLSDRAQLLVRSKFVERLLTRDVGRGATTEPAIVEILDLLERMSKPIALRGPG